MAKKNNDLASERKIHIIDDKTSPFVVTESFRKITTNIGFAIPKKRGRQRKNILRNVCNRRRGQNDHIRKSRSFVRKIRS